MAWSYSITQVILSVQNRHHFNIYIPIHIYLYTITMYVLHSQVVGEGKVRSVIQFPVLLLLLRPDASPCSFCSRPPEDLFAFGSWHDFEEVGDISSTPSFLRGEENEEETKDGSTTGG